jgi:hypothetical protein
MALFRMNEEQGKDNPEQQNTGDNPYERIVSLLVDLFFLPGSHINFTFRDFSLPIQKRNEEGLQQIATIKYYGRENSVIGRKLILDHEIH